MQQTLIFFMEIEYHQITRTQRAQIFRQRILQVMQDKGLNRSQLADRSHIDRSTISLLLSDVQLRLPTGHVVAQIAGALGVTTDWLLGLTTDSQVATELLRQSLEVAETTGFGPDSHTERWMIEFQDAKVRNVPVSLPELMKTDKVVQLEYGKNPDRSVDQAKDDSAAQLANVRLPGRDVEFAMPWQSIAQLTQRAGVWAQLSAKETGRQIAQMADLCEELYPATRLHLFDLTHHYSAAISVFGQRRAVVYIGTGYLVFHSTQHVAFLTRQFDTLVKNAVVRSDEVHEWLRQQLKKVRQ
jgi:transcriptional regulator with XRE-family HTH domain